MLSLPAAVRIFLCTTAIDMRQGFDRLAGLAHEVFAQDPLSGHLFLFLNRRRDRLKALFWDRDGLAVFYKKHETECRRMFGFTEVGRLAHNCRIGLVEAGRMV
jgi:transposase